METNDYTMKAPVDRHNGFFEIDYKHPATNLRVRRRIKCDAKQISLLKDLLESIISNRLDANSASLLIRTNSFFKPMATFLEEQVQDVYYRYFTKENTPNYSAYEELKTEWMDSNFPLDVYDARICMLGRVGSGKSTIIKKLTCFWDNEQLNFPFTDQSRTTTYNADYCLVNRTSDLQFFATFYPNSFVDMYLQEGIERAVSAYFKNSILEPRCSEEVLQDEVIAALLANPTQAFDMRYSLGKYRKVSRGTNPDNDTLWGEFYSFIRDLACFIMENEDTRHKNVELYLLRFTDIVKEANPENAIYKLYQSAFRLIKNRMLTVQYSILENLKENPAITHMEVHIKDEAVPYFSCLIQDVESPDFLAFIKPFTSKEASYFGASLLNIVSHLRIEIPFHKHVELPSESFSLVFCDTVGIAHKNDGSNGFENSTNLAMDDVDFVILTDDSRTNGDQNMFSLLSHLSARIAPSKLFFAFTFFDELHKAEFDSEEDLDEQKMTYLLEIEKKLLQSVILQNEQAVLLSEKLNPEESFFMKNLMSTTNFDSVNHMLEILVSNLTLGKKEPPLQKLRSFEPFVTYDYKKIPLLYQQALNSFLQLQRDIYQAAPPHYKTTEALTNRLSLGITYFSGARLLRPVDDLYDLMIKSFSSYLDKPSQMNFVSRDETDVTRILGELKTKITEGLRQLINKKFCTGSITEEWGRLYRLSGTGSDQVRRNGILSIEDTIVPNIELYLDDNVQEHMINSIEELINEVIQDMDKNFFS